MEELVELEYDSGICYKDGRYRVRTVFGRTVYEKDFDTLEEAIRIQGEMYQVFLEVKSKYHLK